MERFVYIQWMHVPLTSIPGASSGSLVATIFGEVSLVLITHYARQVIWQRREVNTDDGKDYSISGDNPGDDQTQASYCMIISWDSQSMIITFCFVDYSFTNSIANRYDKPWMKQTV